MGKKTNLKTSLVMSLFLLAIVSTAGAEIIYVDADASLGGDGSSWATAYRYLQDALSVALSGDEIWVAAGYYMPDRDEAGNVTPFERTETFQLINGVAIYGGFPNGGGTWQQRDPNAYETILSGDIEFFFDNSYDSYHVVTGSGTDATAVLDGVTITAGNANGSSPTSFNKGGGMYNKNGSPTVTNCTFRGNTATYGGGMYNENGSPTVTNCTFSGNKAQAVVGSGAYGSGMCNYESSPTVVNCTFSDNDYDYEQRGGGMGNLSNSSPTVTNCTFSGNEMGGMYNYLDSSPAVTNCTFTGNVGIGMANSSGSSPIVTNCTFTGNIQGMGNNNDSNSIVTNCTFSGNQGRGMSNLTSSPTVTNCTFRANTATYGGGMYNYYYSSPTVISCTFSGNWADDGGGMGNYTYSSPTVTNCTFSGNSASNFGGGMGNYTYSSPTVTNCTFNGNSAGDYGGGIYNRSGSSPTLTNCTLWGNTAASDGNEIAVAFGGGGAIGVNYCDVKGGQADIYNDGTGTVNWGSGNIDRNPLFVDADGADNTPGTDDDNLRLQAGSPCIDAGDNTAVPGGVTTDLDGNPRFVDDPFTTDTGNPPGADAIVDVGTYEYQPGIVYVDADASTEGDGTTWGTAYNYLQDALTDAAVSGKDIWVAEGTYRPDEDAANPTGTGLRTDTFALISGVALYGGFPSGGSDFADRNPNQYETILSGDLLENDGPDFANNGENSYHVVLATGIRDSDTILDGFTITGGNAEGSSPYNDGGGMFNYNSKPTIANCTFRENSANHFGAGMYNEWSHPAVTNCTFSGNSSGSRGGGMYNDNGDPKVTNCLFIGNSANDDGGAMGNSMSSSVMTNCMFSSNSAGYGGAVYNTLSTSLTLTNCTFSANSASDGGNALACDSRANPSTVQLVNCILWDGGDEIWNNDASTITITYSDVQGGYGGTGNIDGDPLFVDPNGPDGTAGTEDDNLRLSSGSPCIDVGDNTAVPVEVETDLDGHPRIIDGDCNDTEVVDMGAYEFNYAYIGDFDYNCKVNFGDLAILGLAWLTEPPDENWNQFCDISIPADNKIDWADVEVLSDNWLAGTEP